MHHLGKKPNMASQGFTCGLSYREVLPDRSSLGLFFKGKTVGESPTTIFIN
jgi:hypothetical protein